MKKTTMRKISAFLICYSIAYAFFGAVVFAAPAQTAPPQATPPPFSTTAEAAVIMDALSGNVLFEKNMDARMFPASTTKITTALIVCEAISSGNANLEDLVTVSETALLGLALDGSGTALKAGEQLLLLDLLKGMLVQSGNDASNVLAEYIAGSVEAFVEKMNARAGELSLKNTHYTNPHGLHDENHYTSAQDLALIAKKAMTYQSFRSVVELAHVKIPPTNLSPERYYINTNNLVGRFRYPQYFYSKAIGVKTGNTSSAGHCLVSAAKDGEKEVISVALKCVSGNESHVESKKMLMYGLENFKKVLITKSGEILGEAKVSQGLFVDHVKLKTSESLSALLPLAASEGEVEKKVIKPAHVRAPIKMGAQIGEVEYHHNGRLIGRAPLVAASDVKRHPLGFLMSFFDFLWSFLPVRIIIYLFCAVVIVYVFLLVIGISRMLKKSTQRRRRNIPYTPPPKYEARRRNVSDLKRRKRK